MRTRFIAFFCGVTALVLMPSCASILTKKSQEVSFKGVPGTTVYDNNKNLPIAHIGANGFGIARINRQLTPKTLKVMKDGYYPQEVKMGVKVQPAFWFNILLGGVPGILIDVATGKMMKYSDKMLDVTLQPLPETLEEMEAEDVVIPMKRGEAVSRDNAGATGMEQTVLRWYFDSDPRGARVFYRVISNVPAEVKNTNETYLTTTPIEETKSFNIPGLTYDNSRNVTVEIKVSKRGYEDQVKRFNVRQALDQQEISGFFELVPKE